MCGILLNIGREEIDANHRCLDIIAHRGPDAFGAVGFVEEGCGVWLGHRRLSIIDLSEAGKQPMSYDDGDYWLSYNGEIYNYIELRAELERDGMEFRSDSDTEVLLAAYVKWGRGCLDKLNGMFAFSLYDRRRRGLLIARDRLGIKPLYYHNDKDNFTAVSEIKQLTGLPGFRPKVNRGKLYHYLNSGDFSFDDETMWEGVMEMPPGGLIELDLSRWRPGGPVAVEKWYDPPFGEIMDIDYEEACEEFGRLLEDSVRLRLRADVPLGFLLSGGLDSSTLVGLAHRSLPNSSLRTYSSRYGDSSIDEGRFIEAVVKFNQADSRLHFPTPDDVVSSMDKVIWHNDLPIHLGSPVPHWLIYHHIKGENDNRKVILEGQGADEILCGYGDFHWAFLNEELRSGNPLAFLSKLTRFQSHHHEPWKIMARKLRRMNFPASVSYPANPMLNTGFMLGDAPVPDIAIRREAPDIPSLHRLRLTILRYILHNVDRNSMSQSRETRVPFLDHRVVEFCLKLPSEHKIKDGYTKRVLRSSMRSVLPEAVLNRTDKQGYSSPVRSWAGGELNDFFRDRLMAAVDLPCVNRDEVSSSFSKFPEKIKAFDPVWWRIICVHRWREMFNIEI